MADLTTIDAVKGYLDIEPEETGTDAKISRLIASESARFISLTKNPILTAPYSETRNGNGSHVIGLRNSPVTATSSVFVDGSAIPQRMVVGDSGWVLVDDCVHLVGYTFTRGVGNITVRYTAGYDVAPAEVSQAVCEMVALNIRGASRIGIMSQSVGGETATFQTLTLPESVRSVMDAYTLARLP